MEMSFARWMLIGVPFAIVFFADRMAVANSRYLSDSYD